MRIDFVTLFPGMFPSVMDASMMARAQEKGLVSWGCVNPRDFTEDKHHKVDDRPFGGGRRILGVVGNLMALPLQLLDRGLELRDRRADVRQLDDVGFGPLHHLAQLRQPVRHPLGRGQAFGEIGENSPGQGDVRRFDGDAGPPGELLDDW